MSGELALGRGARGWAADVELVGGRDGAVALGCGVGRGAQG
jgi:hypothetical protein